MIFMQAVTLVIVVFVIVMIYAVAIKLVNEHRKLQSIKEDTNDQDNLDLTNKQ